MADLKLEPTRQINRETNRPTPEAVLKPVETEKIETNNEVSAKQERTESAKPTTPTEKVRHSRPANLNAVQPIRDQLTRRVEKILEEGLTEPFHRLSPLAQQEFKLKGEQTAGKIGELLKSTHIKVKKIFQLIMEWLKLLPGINRFFLEQEAKIKTDRIIAIHKNI